MIVALHFEMTTGVIDPDVDDIVVVGVVVVAGADGVGGVGGSDGFDGVGVGSGE